VYYPDALASVWSKNGIDKPASFTVSNARGGTPESLRLDSEIGQGLGAVEVSLGESYISFQVEPRFTNSGLAATLNHTSIDSVSLMRLSSRVLCLSKDNVSKFSELAQEYIAIPRNARGECLHVRVGDTPQNVNSYIYVALHEPYRSAYICRWLNTSQGRSLRESIWKQINSKTRFAAGMLKDREVIEFLAQLLVPYLKSAQMNRIAIADSQIEQSINLLQALRDDIWLDDDAINSVQTLTGGLTSNETLGAWAEQLPYPLAASLRTYETFNLDDGKAADQLIHFWEATATFHATYLLSALLQSTELWNTEIPRLRAAIENGHCNFDRASLGTWRITIEYLSTRFLTMLNSSDETEQDRLTNLLGSASRRTLEKLLSPKIGPLLGQVNAFRNRYDGHSGTMSDDQDREKKDGLLVFTNELKSEIGNAWLGLQLVRPGAQHNLDDGTFVDCEVLMGPTTPFITKQMRVNENLKKGNLYLLSEEGSTKIAPLIQMNSSPVEIRNTCYFYNRTEPDGIRLVSYHLAMQNEWKDDSDQLLAMLHDMQTLSISPLEEL
jgi:hypothetical protein